MSSTALPTALIRLWTARLASKLALCGAMTYDLYQLSKARGPDGALKLGVSDEGKRQLTKAANRPDREKERGRSVEDVFISGLVAAGSCRRHSTRVGCGWVQETRVRRERVRRGWETGKFPRRDFSTSDGRAIRTGLAVRQAEVGRRVQAKLPERTEFREGENSQPGAAPRRGGPHEQAEIPSRVEVPRLTRSHEAEAHKAAPSQAGGSRNDAPYYSKEEYIDLVQTYDSPAEILEPELSKYPKREHLPLAPRLVISPEQEEREAWKGHEEGRKKRSSARLPHFAPEDEQVAYVLERLQGLLRRDPGRVSTTMLWNLYQSLPATRLGYLGTEDVRLFFRHLRWVEFKTSPHAFPRYMGLLEDCLSADHPVQAQDWNTAIAFAGHWVRDITSREVKAAVEMWMRMERSGTAANHGTFIILFDVAIKANRFALADTIHAELQARNMPLDRYFRTSLIYSAGLRGSGDAIRAAFRDLVHAGEIVDTSVMNCVIVSLIRAGEPGAAEHVFGKMKLLYAEKLGTATPSTWQSHRELNILLHRISKRLRADKAKAQDPSSFFSSHFSTDDRKEEIQRASPIKPNERTYRILITHHCCTTGDLDRVRELVDEMRAEGHHLHGSVYVQIFRGFYAWGGYGYSAWTRKLLESFWETFLAEEAKGRGRDPFASPALASSDASGDNPGAATAPTVAQETTVDDFEPEAGEMTRAPYFCYGSVYPVLRAFYKCAGPKRVREVWEAIQERWVEMDERDDRERFEAFVGKLERGY
ncbi:hypothetical protein B0A50_05723 [Salinomyces thailandicus]|uniref:Pentatricopeptide repeat protein n=1 Tax=Salinomyces thailandicus TaxID=706561 RepID=A0A4U0TSG5_9PEZI|nr:hypothetical protein B0A50_05723 [Salinomyces thailandica]